MTRLLLATAFLGAFGLAAGARAEDVSPNGGLQAKLGAMNVSIYYQPTDAGYQVVTTASTEAPDSAIRFIATLAPGQDAVVSVPRGAGQTALELHLRRVGDRVELIRPIS
jgi:hypothetical protein